MEDSIKVTKYLIALTFSTDIYKRVREDIIEPLWMFRSWTVSILWIFHVRLTCFISSQDTCYTGRAHELKNFEFVKNHSF